MSWISRAGPLTRQEMENNANIVINYYRSININDNTIAGILGNMQAESSINPERQEVGRARIWPCSVDTSFSTSKSL